MHIRNVSLALLLCCSTVFAQQLRRRTGVSIADSASASSPSAPEAPRSFDLSAIDKSANACTDFYQYACGNWVKTHTIPPDQTRWGRFAELAEYDRYLLYRELQVAAQHPKTALQKKYGEFYAACMDRPVADRLGYQPIQPLLKQVNALTAKRQIPGLIAQFHAQNGTSSLFYFTSQQSYKDATRQIADASQGGLGLPDRSYYLDNDAHTLKIRNAYIAHVVRMFQLIGDSPTQAQKEATNVLAIETALARASMPRDHVRNPENVDHFLRVTQLQALSPAFNWSRYLKGIGLENLKTLNVDEPAFFQGANALIEGKGLPVWKSYLRWNVVHSAARFLSSAFVDANFDFYGRTLQGQKKNKARWKRCTALTDQNLGMAVGQDWVAQHFPPSSKERTEKIVVSLEAAMKQDIAGLPWMTAATKKQAEVKLSEIRNKIGYPAKWRDYSALTVRPDDLVGNVQRAISFKFRRQLNKIGKPVNEKEWEMTPPTVNAYYDDSMNDINFPAGILQPPFFDPTKDAAVNYGAIGMVIGHEMTHAFDDQGSKYDGKGNLRQWWTPADRKAFDRRTACEVKEYDGFETAPGTYLNGKLTLGENTADNGGLRLAYQALMDTLKSEGPQAMDRKVDGYTAAQQFFISYGQIWCSKQTNASKRVSAKVDPHSTGKWRINGVVRNMRALGKAFGCTTGQPMMPANVCRVW